MKNQSSGEENSDGISPHVSVIIPVFNASETLSMAIRSVLSQDYRDLEIIVIDDGSTDNTQEVYEVLQKSDSRVRSVFIENSGPSAARNIGIKSARGKFVMFLDSDDILIPGALGRIVAEQRKMDVDCVKTAYIEEDLDGILIQRRLGIPELVFAGASRMGELREAFMRNIEHCFSWSWLFRREILQSIRFPENLRYMEDVIFLSELLLRAKSCSVRQFPTVIYRQATTSLTRNPDKVSENIRISIQVARKVVEDTPPREQERRAEIARDKLERLARSLWMSTESGSLNRTAFAGLVAEMSHSDDFKFLRRTANAAGRSLSSPLLNAIDHFDVGQAWAVNRVAATCWATYRRVRMLVRRAKAYGSSGRDRRMNWMEIGLCS